MGLPQSPSTPPHLYPQALQLKLYQAFIFSIPILFSVILILLFYLFYLKRRASILSSTPPILPTTSNQASSYVHSMGWSVDIRGKLPIVLFDEELKGKDTQCCVCLGEFEIKEELLQVPSCKHVFHVDCLNHWLHSNRTCPLCRCCIIPITFKLHNIAPPPIVSESQQQDHNTNSNHNQQNTSSELHRQLDGGGSNAENSCRQQLSIPIEGSSSESTG